MNEGAKTGVFWGVAVAMLVIAMLVAWPKATDEPDTIAGQQLFEKFTDPLAAASMKIVTFDEEQGTLDTFEVRKDRETELWTIPSRNGYPADAIEQMKDAANALVGLKILDIQTANAEDHDELGVGEPKLEDLEVGDEGVGRLVSFKDASQETLASLIIGDPLKDDPQKRYVRIPGQDPVYVVKLDETPLTTQFQDWIEDDLLQLSSIDIAEMEIKDYNASLGIGGQISLTRNYAATVEQDGSQWTLKELIEFDPKDPLADPTPVEVGEDQQLNKTKLDAIKNALDDLKIADVVRKPDGMSATLRANQDLLSDKDAVSSLAQRGFYPVPSGPQGEVEILSANGEMSVSLNDGVKYIMRFGNIAGVTNRNDGDEAEDGTEEGQEDEVDTGVNRYLLVTTMVDESKFPPPELKPVPQTLEDLEAILNPKQPEPVVEEDTESTTETSGSETSADDAAADESGTDTEPETSGEETSGDAAPASESSGESESSGSGEASGSGQAQEDAAPQQEDTSQEDSAEKATTTDESETATDESETATQPPAEDKTETTEPAAEESDDEELTEEEKQERLEAEQEKITKENQRKLDERKDKIEAAERRVRDLNARFADWYYVIPEDTYSKLRVKRDELFEKPDDPSTPPGPPDGLPQFNLPGLPGGAGN